MTPWNIRLPTELTVGGKDMAIRTDYRVALDCFLALTDSELDDYNRIMEVLDMLYVDEIEPRDWKEAVEQAMWYLRGGQEERTTRAPQLVSWVQDFPYIASPISAVVGRDIRDMDMHWWTFLSAYMAIGDCLFAQIVRIRDMKARGKRMDKTDKEFYRRNKDLIDIQKPLTQAEEDILKEWI